MNLTHTNSSLIEIQPRHLLETQVFDYLYDHKFCICDIHGEITGTSTRANINITKIILNDNISVKCSEPDLQFDIDHKEYANRKDICHLLTLELREGLIRHAFAIKHNNIEINCNNIIDYRNNVNSLTDLDKELNKEPEIFTYDDVANSSLYNNISNKIELIVMSLLSGDQVIARNNVKSIQDVQYTKIIDRIYNKTNAVEKLLNEQGYTKIDVKDKNNLNSYKKYFKNVDFVDTYVLESNTTKTLYVVFTVDDFKLLKLEFMDHLTNLMYIEYNIRLMMRNIREYVYKTDM